MQYGSLVVGVVYCVLLLDEIIGTCLVLHSMVFLASQDTLKMMLVNTQCGVVWCSMVWYGVVHSSMEAADFPLPTPHCSRSPHQRNGIPLSSPKFALPESMLECSELANLSPAYFTSGWPCHLLLPHISNRMAPGCRRSRLRPD